MKDKFINKVGKWGCGSPVETSAEGRSTDRADRRDRRHYDYLKRYSPTVINAMRLDGTLERYITDFDRDTQEMYEHMIRQYVELEGVTEELKAEDNLEWTRRMNSIRSRVEEFILHDQVFN